MGGAKKQERISIVKVISNLEYGGAERQVVELANTINKESFDVHVCSLSGYVPLAQELEHKESRLHIVSKHFKYDVSVIPRLALLLNKLKPDIVHSYLFDADIAARIAGRLTGSCKIVCSERNTDYKLKSSQAIAYWITKRWVDLIVANSKAGADFNGRLLGYRSSMYRVVHNGVDTKKFSPGDGNKVRHRLGIRANENLVGMFASFKKQKNHPLFFKAARCLLEKLPNTRFMLVGDMLFKGLQGSDDYVTQMKNMVDGLGIRKNFLFLGNCDNVAELYSACDVTVLPSIREGTPNVVLESMASGTPVIATNISDNPQIIPHGQVGYIVDLGLEKELAHRLFEMLSNEEKRQKMGLAAREWVMENFSTSALARKTEKVYHDLLKGSDDN